MNIIDNATDKNAYTDDEANRLEIVWSYEDWEWVHRYQVCYSCGGEEQWCDTCQCYTCFDCSDYGTCGCS